MGIALPGKSPVVTLIHLRTARFRRWLAGIRRFVAYRILIQAIAVWTGTICAAQLIVAIVRNPLSLSPNAHAVGIRVRRRNTYQTVQESREHPGLPQGRHYGLRRRRQALHRPRDREHMRRKGLPGGDKPVLFLDTETGSNWVKPRFDAANIPLFVAKTRSFVDLLTAVGETEQEGAFLLIDSISHFWTGLCDEYAKRKGRKRGLEFSDWAWLRQEWRRFTDRYVNSCHIVLCGRAGYEYDFFEGEDGKKNLEKTGVKMKAEGETGYEPSILILMEKQMDITINPPQVWRTATILKDRSTEIDGKQFANPTFADFLPHIEYLNLGGTHLGVDISRDNAELFADDGEPRGQTEKRMKEIALDEIVELLGKHFPGQTAEMKKAKADKLELVFNTRSWERIRTCGWHLIDPCRWSPGCPQLACRRCDSAQFPDPRHGA